MTRLFAVNAGGRGGWRRCIALALLVLSGCARNGEQSSGQDATGYRIVTTTGMIADIVRQVAGDRASVESLMKEGVDPHLYQPRTGDTIALQQAEVVFYNGLLLEGKMQSVLERVAGEGKQVHAVGELVKARGYAVEQSTGHADPHIWMDVSAWMDAVRSVEAVLSAYDAEGASIYRANAEEYLRELALLDQYAHEAIISISQTQRVLITAHDAFGYMGRAYGLEVRGIQGISTESEAGLRDVNELIAFIVEREIGAVFVESSVPRKGVQALLEGSRSRGHEVRIGGELFSDAMGAPGTWEGTYIGMIDHNVTTIAQALGGNVPAGGFRTWREALEANAHESGSGGDSGGGSL